MAGQKSKGQDMKSTRKAMCRVAAVVLELVGLAGTIFGQNSGDSLEIGFKTPPNSAKPRVWLHWMNGNITMPWAYYLLEPLK